MKLIEALEDMYESGKVLPIYKDMVKRGGKPAIFRGSENPEVLLVGEAGGKDEDRKGKPFVGRAGQVLQKWINHCKIKEYAIINCVPYMPELNGKIRPPTIKEIDFFRMKVVKIIECLKPKYLILMGRTANRCLCSKELRNKEWDRKIIQKFGHMDIGFIYHPAYYLRKGQDGKNDFIELWNNRKI